MADDSKTGGGGESGEGGSGEGGSGTAWPASDIAGAVEQFGNLSAASLEMWSAWAKTWETVLGERGWAALNASVRGASASAPLPGGDAESMGESLEEAFGLPHLADMVSLDTQAFRALQPSLDLLRIRQEYAVVTGQLWIEACRRFHEQLEEARAEGRQLDSVGEVLDVWNEVLDRTMIEFNRSTKFGELQRRFLRATMTQRLEQRRLSEKVCELYDMPTRTEVDELHRKMHDLHREVRRLRRAVGAAAPPESGEAASGETPEPENIAARRRQASGRSKSGTE